MVACLAIATQDERNQGGVANSWRLFVDRQSRQSWKNEATIASQKLIHK
jgi:hypothetical protein